MRLAVHRSLEEVFREHPVLVAGPVPTDELDLAASELGVVFDRDYREFVSRYGGAIVGGDAVFGLRVAEAMGKFTVTSATKHFRKQRWPGTERLYVISIDGAGNPVGIDADGRVVASYHDGGDLTVIARGFEEYVQRLLDGR